MASIPRPDDDLDENDDGFDDNDDDEVDDDGLDDGTAQSSGGGGATDSGSIGDAVRPADAKAAATPTIASSQPPVALPAATDQLAITEGSSPSGPPVGVKIFLGVAGGLLALVILFALGTFLLRRRWRKEALNPDRREIIYEAPGGDDEEGGQAAQWKERPSMDSKDSVSTITPAHEGGHSRKSSRASEKDYLKTHKHRDSLGSYQAPGIAMEEAYTMFGGSKTTLVDEGEKTHSRHNSDGASILDGRPRSGSLLGDQSRYPSLSVSPQTNRRLLRHSVSYTGSADPFGDSTGQQPLRRTQTTEAPSPTSSSGSPKEGKRISLRGGVGVRARTPVPQSPPAVAVAN